MDPVTGAIAAKVATTAVLALAKKLFKKDNPSETELEYARQIAIREGMNPPTVQQMMYVLPTYEEQKIADALLEQPGQSIAASDLDKDTNPMYVEALNKSMQNLARSSKEGLSAQAKLDFDTITSQVGSTERAQREAIAENFRARGMGGAGQEQVAKLANSANANRALREKALAIAAANANTRREDNLQLGKMGSQEAANQFNRQLSKAEYKTRVDMANAMRDDDLRRRNTDAQRDIIRRREGESHAAYTSRLNEARRQAEQGSTLTRQQYEDQLAKATDVGNLKINYAKAKDTRKGSAEAGAHNAAAGVVDILAPAITKGTDAIFSGGKGSFSNLLKSSSSDDPGIPGSFGIKDEDFETEEERAKRLEKQGRAKFASEKSKRYGDF